MIRSEESLIQLTLSLGAANFGGPLSSAEVQTCRLAVGAAAPLPAQVTEARSGILAGGDPLGDAFCDLRNPSIRRASGAVYTPQEIVMPMVHWTLDREPCRVIDAGSGSGRFLAEVLRRRPDLEAVAIDEDPVATLMTRAMLAVMRIPNAHVIQGNYTALQLPSVSKRTAFIGNPPYVRHHQLTTEVKVWAQGAASRLGLSISGLAGLHAHFFLATAVHGQLGDVGCFVTSAEWLDVNYGAVVRSLVAGRLGGRSLHVIEPKALPFQGTQTTAVITTFEIGNQDDIVRLQDVESADELKDLATSGQPVERARLQESSRWTGLLRSSAKVPAGFIQLGELCRVHRGAVTGANAIWVLRHQVDLPASVLYRSITRARELFAAGSVLADDQHLRLVVDIPSELDDLDSHDRDKVHRFIKAAKQAGADKGYIAAHRRSWWSVGLTAPAPILATYMARRSPAFVMNAAKARHLNIAHGLYPRQNLDARTLERVAQALRIGAPSAHGRVYAGGLIKFEPREMERLMIPDLSTLTSHEPLTPEMDAS
ncbi:MAG: methyltransferase [Streptosporangiaceae bacterium]